MHVQEFRDQQAKAMSEEDLAAQVAALCKAYDVWRYHTYDSRRSEPGYPDETLIGVDVIWRELKREKGRPTPAQTEVIGRLRAAGKDVDIWRPSDLLSGRIEREIAALSTRKAWSPRH